jgi:hypothetical protein
MPQIKLNIPEYTEDLNITLPYSEKFMRAIFLSTYKEHEGDVTKEDFEDMIKDVFLDWVDENVKDIVINRQKKIDFLEAQRNI